MLRSGVLLGRRYRLTNQIATGGMGEVWRADDIVLGRPVAVKVLLPALLADPDFVARFRAEARILATLRHPGVVQVYDSGEDTLDEGGKVNFLVMQYVDGEPLSQRIAANGRLAVTETMSVIAQAAQALHAAHQAGTVHRDVKPSNLLIQPDGTVVLVDFGVARSANVTSVTSTNAVPGTALYMAPEQAAGRPVSAATDIYALGAVAYHCLTGSPPFTAENALQVAIRHLHDEPPPLPDGLPAPVVALVTRALAKNPAERFPDAKAMAAAARRAAADPRSAAAGVVGPAPLRPPVGGTNPATLNDVPVITDAQSAPGQTRRSPIALVGGVVAALLIATGLTAVLAFGPTGNPPVDTMTPTPTLTPTQSQEPTRTESGPNFPQRPRPGQEQPTADPSGSPGSPEPPEPSGPTPEPTDSPTGEPTDTPTGEPQPSVTPSPKASEVRIRIGG